jgi:hypothetical protein
VVKVFRPAWQLNTQERHNHLAKDLLKNPPFQARVKHYSKPWGKANQPGLQNEVDTLTHWNGQLYIILPQRLRDFFLEQCISGYILYDPQVADDVSALVSASSDHGVLGKSANLVVLREKTTTVAGHNGFAMDVVNEMVSRLPASQTCLAPTTPDNHG